MSSDPIAVPAATYRGMARPEIDAAYNNSAAVKESPRHLADWERRSAIVRARPDARLDLAYGPAVNNRIDYFPAKAGAPLFVFVHGGYWFRNRKEIFAFAAEGPLAHGISVATVGYTLAPQAGLSEIVREVAAAIDHLSGAADDLGFDAEALVIGGWSAGGHLAALAATHPAVKGALPISGIFDLAPIRISYINDALALTEAEVAGLSPLFNLPAHSVPMRLFVGGDELPELRRQSSAYAEAAATKGLPVTLDVIAGKNHFTILELLGDGASVLTRGLTGLIEDARRQA